MKRILAPLGLLCLFVACTTAQSARPVPSDIAREVPSEIRKLDATSQPARVGDEARVLRVTDGDTVVLSGIDFGELDRSTGGRKARLIGVDTPEVFGKSECFGREASAFTKRELDGERVRIASDVGKTDRYGRALVYIWDADGRFFNARLVEEGYALQMTVPPNVRYAELFTKLARQAREQRRGLWMRCA